MNLTTITVQGKKYWKCGTTTLSGKTTPKETLHRHLSASEAQNCAELHGIFVELVDQLFEDDLLSGSDKDGIFGFIEAVDDLITSPLETR